jgi:tRNA pseudouridine(55) synthase
MSLAPYIILEKQVGETPLENLEAWRATEPSLQSVPLAYAGRLDPMASGKLLILIGEECKRQEEYHNLDKEYQVSILFGTHSDSGDVLGLIKSQSCPTINKDQLEVTLQSLIGEVELPYPIFSAKTVGGKPLHTWAMEGRLSEITIPRRKSIIYQLTLNNLTKKTRKEIVNLALAKIDLIPKVTDPRKALGNDFRRTEVKETWQKFLNSGKEEDLFTSAQITCICSSGTYMRTLAEVIGETMNMESLAFSIHRSIIGKYDGVKQEWVKLFI